MSLRPEEADENKMLCYLAAFLDRVNIGFAPLIMNADLSFSASAFSFGSGIFFLGYVLCELPSNLMLALVGASLWIARFWSPGAFFRR